MARKLRKKHPPVGDPDALKLFWWWISERHGAWHKRTVLQQPPPWTQDTVIATNFFTNVYRELDPGTRFIRGWLPRASSIQEAVFWTLAYRLAFNERSMNALLEGGLMNPYEWPDRSPKVRGMLHSMAHPFTGAYLVSNYGIRGSKVDVIVDKLLGIAEQIKDHYPEYPGGNAHRDRQSWVNWCLTMANGIGKFVAFQTLVDLSYPGPPTAPLRWLPFDNEGWCVAGPGAEKGLKLLFPNEAVTQRTSNKLIQTLCYMQEFGLATGLPGWWHGGPRVHISAANMQNCCCEYGKYRRIIDGGKAKRKFRPKESHTRDREDRGHGQQMEMPE